MGLTLWLPLALSLPMLRPGVASSVCWRAGLRSLVPSALLMALFAGVYEWDQEGAQLLSYGLEEFPQLAAVPAVLTLLPLIMCVQALEESC